MRMFVGQTNGSLTADRKSPLEGVARGGPDHWHQTRQMDLVPSEPRSPANFARRTRLSDRRFLVTRITRPVWLKQMPLLWRLANQILDLKHQKLRNTRNVLSQ